MARDRRGKELTALGFILRHELRAKAPAPPRPAPFSLRDHLATHLHRRASRGGRAPGPYATHLHRRASRGGPRARALHHPSPPPSHSRRPRARALPLASVLVSGVRAPAPASRRRSHFPGERKAAEESLNQVAITSPMLGVIPSVWAWNLLLKFITESGEYEMVLTAYDEMKRFHPNPDVHTFYIVTSSLFQAKKVDEALQVWAEMIEMGVKPDKRGYSSFLIGLCDYGKYDLAYAILQEITTGNVLVEAMAYNMIMDGLCKAMRLEEAEKLLENKARQGSTPDVYGYSYLIRSYCKMGNLMKALDHYETMVSHGIETNCHIVSYLLQCFRKLGMTSEVTGHFKKFRDSGLHLDGIIYNIAMDAYCKDGNMTEAVKLLNEMKSSGLTPDKIHYTCIINGYCLKGEIQNAQQVFEEMLKADIEPDVVTYNILANGFCKSGLVMEVFDLIDHMTEQGSFNVCRMMLEHNVVPDRGLSVDVIVYTILMNGYCKVGRLQEACDLFVQMINLGIKPDVIAYTVLLDGHLKETLQQGWQGIAKERRTFLLRANHNKLLCSMKDMHVEPDVPCYTVLIDGKCKAEFLVEARELFDEMLQKGLTPDAYAYTALINGYCSQGEIAKAEDLLQEMIDKGIKPDALTFSVLNQSSLSHVLISCQRTGKRSMHLDRVCEHAKGDGHMRAAVRLGELLSSNQGSSTQNKHYQEDRHLLTKVNFPSVHFSEIDKARHQSYMNAYNGKKSGRQCSKWGFLGKKTMIVITQLKEYSLIYEDEPQNLRLRKGLKRNLRTTMRMPLMIL
ncbi:hypothetical protein GUJ93_ZPchr0674g29024 [Zizania palustris]|uniref:Pentacotripeptide-repeat region of PRORP domain-containing protein n=1 Tax=Zizania palustris TaxID=103762 RepID=A0A8J5RBZ4_ZIZPA|nr:hypothetical protein GUJ93_ZPchr0674g29024 [Zizania palustris]